MPSRSPLLKDQIVGWIRSLVVACVYLWRSVGLPGWLLIAPPLKYIYRYWSKQTMLTFISSRGKTLPMDQFFELKNPHSFAPKSEASPEYQLSEEEIEGFYRNGFLEPIQIWDEFEMREFGEQLLAHCRTTSTVYGKQTKRDRHLDGAFFLRLINHPGVVQRVAQLLGSDLKVWRSYLFHKPPGGRKVTWHQESSYMYENKFTKPIVAPTDPSELFQITVWVAVSRTTMANGCLRVVPGSHRTIHNLTLGGKEGYEDAAFSLDYEIKPTEIRNLEMSPGQAIIMSERTIHGSEANTTQEDRIACNFRFVRGDTTLHPHLKPNHYAAQLRETFDMSQWREVLIQGQDFSSMQRSVPIEQLLQELEAHDPVHSNLVLQ